MSLELWTLSIIPFLAVITALDSVARLSHFIARAVRWRHEDVILLILVLIAAVAFYQVAISPHPFERIPQFINYATVEEMADAQSEKDLKMGVVPGYFLLDVIAVIFVLRVGLRLARRSPRPIWAWLPIIVLGNLDAVLWLFLDNRRLKSS